MKIQRIFAVFLAFGLIFSSFILFQRVKSENQYKHYEITLDYNDMERFSSETSKDIKSVLSDFKEAGAASVNVGEATINSLKLNTDYKISTSFEGYDLVVRGESSGLKFIENGLDDVLKERRRMTYRDENTLVIEGKPKDLAYDATVVRDYDGNKIGTSTIGQSSKLEYAGLGFLTEEIETAKTAGLQVLLRPVYQKDLQDAKKSIDRFFDTMENYDISQSYVIFAGEQALGTDTQLEYMAERLEEKNVAIAMVEASVQREHLETIGVEPLVEEMDYKAVRAFTTWQFIQKRFDYNIPFHHNGEEIVNTFYRAITERNIRIIYFKPFIKPNGDAVTDMQIYKDRFSDLQARLLDTHNIVPGPVQTMGYLNVSRFMQMMSAFGAIAAAFILLDNLLKISRKPLLYIFAGTIFATAAIYAAGIKLELVNKMFGLLSTIIFPSLSVIFVLALIKQILSYEKLASPLAAFGRGIFTLIIAVVISIIGAVYQVAFFAHSRFLLELDIFSGVKLSQVAPLMITGVAYLAYFGYSRKDKEGYLRYDEIKSFLMGNIKIWQALGATILIGIVAMLLLRSGHESNVEPSSIELLMRNTLEQLLAARPRNKAFLLGYPALIVFVYLAFNKKYMWSFPALALLVSIGQSNILNTFSHIRTPIYISYLRVSYELGLSILVAGIVILVLILAEKLISKTRHNKHA